MKQEVVVVIGVGGIGQAIARRQGAGKEVLLADLDEVTLATAAMALEGAGYAVKTQHTDVSSRASVHALAETACSLGEVTEVIHTAGLSPNMASPEKILAVDLLGTALVLDEFGSVIAIGGSGIVISSMAGHMIPALPVELEQALAGMPADELLTLPALQPSAIANSGAAYALSKRANHLRVQAASLQWAKRGARVNAISPGIIMTSMAQKEMASDLGDGYRAMIAGSAIGRVGTADEVASAAAYLLGPEATFVTGSDLLIDGGVIAAIRSGRIDLSVG